MIEPLQPLDLPETIVGTPPAPTPVLELTEREVNAWGPFVLESDFFTDLKGDPHELGSRLRCWDADRDGCIISYVGIELTEHRLVSPDYPARAGDRVQFVLARSDQVVTIRPLEQDDWEWLHPNAVPTQPLELLVAICKRALGL